MLSSANRSKSDFVVIGPTILYGAGMDAGTDEIRLLPPSMSVFSHLLLRGLHLTEPAPVVGGMRNRVRTVSIPLEW